ncbi:inosine guanosine and xanthosine phosphorylase family protein [Coprinopsis cinerea okayama7|uniref:Purine nucleoside phosphorylase n=1 Tax=Coprinopsis cinerea (strain Okayama-7 / 130 / ATCC MYA-4618 / FGSC 9003) TaxID=240176 RepID=A8P0B0_COPC7|nr:inosine guanosine and xanthosine phosphorylase family protein [Coprinopsis cinerea okayama7\|eukprot:XP_001837849.1 inosine guanosine and xanthosine phosphorylase family protein [Coprinopsis cinerea okayama7\
MPHDTVAKINFAPTLEAIFAQLPDELQKPQLGIICGSGLSGLVGALKDVVIIPYEKIPGFSRSTVPGHKSALAFGFLGSGKGLPVVAMLGRFHPYEGHSLSSTVFPVRVMAKLGIKDLIITNAAGSLNPSIPVGTIVIIQDHIALPNLTGMNPLLGPHRPDYVRFLPLSDAYSPALRRLAFLAANKLNLEPSALAEGTYAWVSGPTYETPAEGRLLRLAGADVVGMSTIPEVLAGREEGLNVMVMSLVTNFVVIPDKYRSIKEEVDAELAGKKVELPVAQVVSHEEVLEIGTLKAEVMKSLVEQIAELKLLNV